MIRFAIVLAILLPLCWVARVPWPRTPREAFHLGAAGVMLQAGYLGGVFASIHQGMPAAVSALIAGVQPVLTALLSARMLGERTSRRQWLGLALGAVGVGLVVREKFVFEGVGAGAVALSVLALASITLGTVYQKRFCGAVDLRTGAAVQFGAALAALAPFAWLFESREVRWTGELALAMAWLVLVLSLGAVFLLLYLIRHGAATRVASLMYLVPPCTALIAWPLFGERHSTLSAAGMGLAVVGVWLVTRARAMV